MELAIPLLALGGLYIISKKKESFVNDHERVMEDFKPSIHKYKPHYAVTDKYFQPNPDYVEDIKTPTYTDLAGRTVNLNAYSEHMVPYFGKMKNIGNDKNTNPDTILDNRTGSGSLQITKSESAPLFRPQENVQWANGSPNDSDFYQSRVNLSKNMNNVKLFQEMSVAPGLNNGYTNQGSGGFNSGMEARDKWVDKTVNELRVATKPKTSFTLENHQGPAQTLVKNLGIEGKVEKYLPDKFFINTPDRYLTTTGATLAATMPSIQPNPTIHRATTSQSYSGPAGNAGVQSATKHGMYRDDHRQQFGSEAFTPAGSAVDMPNTTPQNDILLTNRSVQNASSFGGMYGIVNALTAPITDLLRPTRKEDLVGLTRHGNAGTTVSNAPIAETVVPPTVKQTTLYSPYDMGQRAYLPISDGAYQVSQQQVSETNRQYTSVSYMGGGMSTSPQMVSDQAERNATISSNRMTTGRIAGGNIQSFNPHINQTTSTNRSSMHSSYVGNVGSSLTAVSPSIELYGGIRNPNKYEEPDRNTPDLLTAFKKNPYTQSLHSVA
jgi:hypothetical protein